MPARALALLAGCVCALRPGPCVCVSTALCEPCDGRAVGLAGQCASQTACGVRARAACAQATIHHKSTSARFLKEERKKKFNEERTASQVRLRQRVRLAFRARLLFCCAALGCAVLQPNMFLRNASKRVSPAHVRVL